MRGETDGLVSADAVGNIDVEEILHALAAAENHLGQRVGLTVVFAVGGNAQRFFDLFADGEIADA